MRLKDGRLVVVAAAAVVMTLFAGQSLPANAAPTPKPSPTPTTVSGAKERVKQLEDQASQIGEDYDTVSDALDEGRQQLKVRQADIAIQQKKVDQLSASAQTIALAQFRSREFDTTMQIFTSSDPDTLLDRLATASKVDETMAKTLSEQQAAQANLNDLQRSAESEVAALAAQEKKLADLKSEIDANVNQAQALVDSLSDADRNDLDSSDGDPTPSDPGDYADADARIKKAIAYALSKVPSGQYVWGADGPNGFDCSGLMLASYRAAGISLPHSSRAQASQGKAVSKSDLKPGDLIFFYHPIHHVGMYIGGGKFVHARNTRADLVVQSLASYPAPWSGARRIIG
jgi:peptidoglycan DL-endopeptidase CwlO